MPGILDEKWILLYYIYQVYFLCTYISYIARSTQAPKIMIKKNKKKWNKQKNKINKKRTKKKQENRKQKKTKKETNEKIQTKNQDYNVWSSWVFFQLDECMCRGDDLEKLSADQDLPGDMIVSTSLF